MQGRQIVITSMNSITELGYGNEEMWSNILSGKQGFSKKYKRINIGNLKTNITNKKINQSVTGNTNTVYINPLNSLRFVLNKVKKDKIRMNKDFWVFTGSSVGVVPIKGKGTYIGKIDKLGFVKANIK